MAGRAERSAQRDELLRRAAGPGADFGAYCLLPGKLALPAGEQGFLVVGAELADEAGVVRLQIRSPFGAI